MNSIPLVGIFMLVLLLPNLLAIVFPPLTRLADAQPPVRKQLQIMTVFERIGQVTCFVLPFLINPW